MNANACRGNESPAASLRASMDNIQFEITHERLVALIAKQLDVEPGQIELNSATVDVAGAVVARVRTDLPTANKIDRKLKRLDGSEPTSDQTAME